MSINEKIDDGQIIEFFKSLNKGIRKFGIKKLITAIKTLDAEENFQAHNIDIIIDYILNCTLEEWSEHKISKDELWEANKRGEATIARKMAIIVIRNNCKVSDIEVGNYFGKVRQVVFKAMREFKQMKKTIPTEAKFLIKFERIDAKVKIFINELKDRNDESSD
jgi:chromosomal replication initiation ATPase DnaA